MIELFIDTTNYNLIIILCKNNKVLQFKKINSKNKVADDLLENVLDILNKNNTDLKNINNFYILTGPGSYIGERVGVTFVKTLFIIGAKFNCYAMDSLAFQGWSEDKTVSLLDARGDKWYIGIYENKKCIIPPQIIPNEFINDFLTNFKEFKIYKNNEQIDYLKIFIENKDRFVKINDMEKLEPTYIKSFI